MARSWEADSLNARRDAYVEGMRTLLARFQADHPDEELELKGILGRADTVLEAQLPTLDDLTTLDLDASTTDLEAVVEVLVRAQHLPRMIQCFSQVLQQEEQSGALMPAGMAAAELGRQLAMLVEAWILRRQDIIGLEGEELP